MNVLAIGRHASCAFDAFVPAEKQRVTEVREEGFIRRPLLKSDKSGPILVLNTPTATGRNGALRRCR
jgi:hypothetical protein